MKTNIFFLSCIGIFLPLIVSAWWYGPTWPASSYIQPISWSSTNCSPDGQNDAIGPVSPDPVGIPLPWSTGVRYATQARVTSPQFWGVITCQRWDSTLPIVSNIQYPSGQNFDPTIFPVVQSSDTGGAWLYQYDLEVRYSSDFPTFSTAWSSWISLPSQNLNPNFYLDTQPFWSGPRGFQFRTRVTDLAWNASPWFEDSKIYQYINSGWYGPNGPQSVYYQDITSATNNCQTDNQLDAINPGNEYHGPNYNNLGLDGEFAVYRRQARANTTYPDYPSIPGKISCQRWDTQKPTMTSISYTGWWTNNPNILLTFSWTDVGGAGIWEYDIEMQYSDNSPDFTAWWSSWTYIGTGSTQKVYFDSTRGSLNRAYKFRARARDLANNASAYMLGSNTLMLDTVTPTPLLLNSSTSTRLLANNAQSISLHFNDTGSPILLSGSFEHYILWSPNINVGYAPSWYAYTQSTIQNISIVDGLDRLQDGNTGREYTYTVTKIRDQAGNEWNGSKLFQYIVYANPWISPTLTLPTPSQLTQLTNATAIWDGSDYPLTLRFADGYGNAIIPATWIARTISLNTQSNNTLYLDQYSRTGNLWAFITPPSGLRTTLSNTQTFPSQLSTDGNYTSQFRSYVPTAGGYTAGEKLSDPDAQLQMMNIWLTSNDVIMGERSVSYNPGSFQFKPLFSTIIKWDVKNWGFIEWVTQNSSLDILKNGSRSSWWSTNPLYIEFSWTTAQKYDIYIGSPNPSVTPVTNLTPLNANPGALPVWDYPFMSRMEQKLWQIVDARSNLIFSTHFRYIIDGYLVTTNSDIIGKDYYHAIAVNSGSAYQVWVKVIGTVGSNISNEIYTNQYQTWVNIFGGINRSTYKNSIRKSIWLALRNVPKQQAWVALNSLTSLPWGSGIRGSYIEKDSTTSILLLEGNGETVEFNLSEIRWVRTIVLRWVNLYLRQDMYYPDKKSILGVYIEKWDTWQGGNLYIDPSITNIVGTYVLDGAVSSYEFGALLDGNTSVNRLKNQLYIYGSIMSENTLGWSRMNPVQCPTLLNIASCTLSIAQTYDLNYLRRYYLIDSTLISPTDIWKKTPFSTAKIIGWGTCTPAWVCSWWNPNLPQKFTSTSHDLAAYPVIIEYNPLIKSIQPIWFEWINE